MKRVLLTGATGFIGRHCLPLLTMRGFDVHAVSSRSAIEKVEGVHWHQSDLLEPAQIAELVDKVRPSHLLHFAWYTEPGAYWTCSENLRWVQASLALLQEFARHEGQRCVMAGTCAEYDWRYGYCSEQVTPLAPTTLYGVCKHALQSMLDASCRHTGLSAAWGRIFFVYGPHERPDRLVAAVIRSVLTGEPARCSHGNQVRDLLYVQDVADAFVTLLESDVIGPVNVASGEPVALRDVIHKIAETRNRPDLIQLGAVPSRRDEPPLLVADVRRLREQVGWQPTFDLDSGLKRTVEWWANHL